MGERYSQDQNYIPNRGRRKLLRNAGRVFGAMATIGGAYELVANIIPSIIHNADQSTLDNNTPECVDDKLIFSPDDPQHVWVKKPVKRENISIKDGKFTYTVPPRSIVWSEHTTPVPNHPPRINIAVNTSDKAWTDIWEAWSVNDNFVAHTYKPPGIGNVEDSFDDFYLLSYNKPALEEKYGKFGQIEIFTYYHYPHGPYMSSNAPQQMAVCEIL